MTIPLHIRATALLDFPAVALEAGIDPDPALREAGIDPAILSRPDLTIPANRAAWLLDRIAERSGLADFGIRIAMRRRVANLGVAGLVLGQQPTARAALAIAEKYRHLLGDALSVHLEDDGTIATLTIALAIGASAPGRQARELALSAYAHLFRLPLGQNWAPTAVHFSHPAPKGLTLHRRFFGCPVQFDSAFDGLECASTDLDRINPDADSALASYASALLDSMHGRQGQPTTAMVTRLVQALLPMGRASVSNVARAMSRHVRTLQRELAAEGAAFTTCLIDARSALAIEALRDASLSVETIAERLGYSHPSAFIRFFRARFGESPGEWRIAAQAAATKDATMP